MKKKWIKIADTSFNFEDEVDQRDSSFFSVRKLLLRKLLRLFCLFI